MFVSIYGNNKAFHLDGFQHFLIACSDHLAAAYGLTFVIAPLALADFAVKLDFLHLSGESFEKID